MGGRGGVRRMMFVSIKISTTMQKIDDSFVETVI